MTSAKVYGRVKEGGGIEYSTKPLSKRTSNLWLNPEQLLAEGWYEVVKPVGSTPRGQKFLGESAEVVDGKLVVSYEFTNETNAEYKNSLFQVLRDNFMGALYGLMMDLPTANTNKSQAATLAQSFATKVGQINSAKTRAEIDAVEVTF